MGLPWAAHPIATPQTRGDQGERTCWLAVARAVAAGGLGRGTVRGQGTARGPGTAREGDDEHGTI